MHHYTVHFLVIIAPRFIMQLSWHILNFQKIINTIFIHKIHYSVIFPMNLQVQLVNNCDHIIARVEDCIGFAVFMIADNVV
jgi:hypothetical protein